MFAIGTYHLSNRMLGAGHANNHQDKSLPCFRVTYLSVWCTNQQLINDGFEKYYEVNNGKRGKTEPL